MAEHTPDPSLDKRLPTYENVVEAALKLNGVAKRTPVMTSRQLEQRLLDLLPKPSESDGRKISVFIKCENFQRMGAFKFRGGYNAISNLRPEEREHGVITYSSGNHAQAIALSAKLLGTKATIIMPKDAPDLKVQATKGYGGNVIFYDRYKQNREAIAEKIQNDTNCVLIPPFNNFFVISGQGTTALELFDQIKEMSPASKEDEKGQLDFLFVCVGGGGLISGCSLVANKLSPTCKVIGVEPEAGDDAKQSLATGKIVSIPSPKTIADGAQTCSLGDLTFAIMKQRVHEIETVSDDELVECMKFYGERMKMIVEPTGCLGLAGLQKQVAAGKIPVGSRVGVIISGGNVDMKTYCNLVS